MSDGRDEILARVREALRVPTAHLPVVPESKGAAEFKRWLPAVGESTAARKALFAELSEKLKTDFVVVSGVEQVRDALRAIAREEHWQRVGLHRDELVDACTGGLEVEKLSTDGGYDPWRLEKCDAGITGCDCLVAQTASVVVTNRSAGGRALSVLPPHHVVLARAGQLVADLPDAFALLRERYAADWPSFMSLITGPSRTGDIERILVLGAHGPKKLTVILIE